MLCRNEQGVLSGSEYFLPTVSQHARQLYYYTPACGHYFCTPEYLIDRRDAQCYLLMVILQGELSVSINGRQVTAHAGESVLLDGYTPHRYEALSGLEFLWMHVAGANSKMLCDSLTEEAGVLVTAQQHAALSDRLEKLLTFQGQQQVSEPLCARTIYEILSFLMPETRKIAKNAGSPVDRAILYIRERLHEPISLGEIAAYVEISPYHFVRVFKKATGYSPYDYLILLRINQAKYLLQNTALTVREVGAEVGYASEVSFINIFTQKVGITPGRFRKLKIG